MNTLQNIMAKSTVTAIIALFFGLTFSARAGVTVSLSVTASPASPIKQGDSSTFTATPTVTADLPAGEAIVSGYFMYGWDLFKGSAEAHIYSYGPTSSPTLTYTFVEGDSYNMTGSVVYYYKLTGDQDYRTTDAMCMCFMDVVKVTAISLRTSGLNKTIGQIWVKDDWDITTVPSGYRDMVDLPDHTIATHLHTVRATCGTSHADFVYRGITIDTHWDAWTPGPDGTYDPDTFDYHVDVQGTDGTATVGVTVETSEGPTYIAGGDSNVSLTGDGTHPYAVTINAIGLCGGGGGDSGGGEETSSVTPTSESGAICMTLPGPTEHPLMAVNWGKVATLSFKVISSLSDVNKIVHTTTEQFKLNATDHKDYMPLAGEILVTYVPPAGSTPPVVRGTLTLSVMGTGYYKKGAIDPKYVTGTGVQATFDWDASVTTPYILDPGGDARGLKARTAVSSSAVFAQLTGQDENYAPGSLSVWRPLNMPEGTHGYGARVAGLKSYSDSADILVELIPGGGLFTARGSASITCAFTNDQ